MVLGSRCRDRCFNRTLAAPESTLKSTLSGGGLPRLEQRRKGAYPVEEVHESKRLLRAAQRANYETHLPAGPRRLPFQQDQRADAGTVERVQPAEVHNEATVLVRQRERVGEEAAP